MGKENSREKQGFRQGDLVIIRSPYTDRSGKKLRPAIIISNERYNKILQDSILVPLSTHIRSYSHIFKIYINDMEYGDLVEQSDVRVDKIISMDQRLIIKRVGHVKTYVIIKIKKILEDLIK